MYFRDALGIVQSYTAELSENHHTISTPEPGNQKAFATETRPTRKYSNHMTVDA